MIKFKLTLKGCKMSDYLMHIGTPHQGDIPHSGRYAWGSGENPFQRYMDFYTAFNRYKAAGMPEREIALKLGVIYTKGPKKGQPDTTMLRAKYANAKAEKRAAESAMAMRLHDEGKSNSEIGRIMGKNESTIRSLLDPAKAARNDLNSQTADVLKDYVDKYKYVDISAGVEYQLGVTQNRLTNAVALLKERGYQEQTVFIDQMGTNHKTTITVLTPPDVTYAELSEHRFDIRYPGQDSRTVDINGDILGLGLEKAPCISSDRIKIRYNEEGGVEYDGNMHIRPGLDDISLGGAQYAQVRIGVDGTHYLKGTAVYDDNLPPGVDIVFNTNKHIGTDLYKVLKPMKTLENGEVDWDNPFGASVSQLKYMKDGKEVISPVHIVRTENEWSDYSNNLASQFLSKQAPALAERQLNLAYQDRKQEFEEIKALTNPDVKKKLLMTFADNCDSQAVDLKAAPFSGQSTYLILPDSRLKDNEVYAPNYRDGTQLALVRYPHGGTFEIPIMTVRNTGSPSVDMIRNAPDAIAINHNVAARLSGADFDGDTVIAIPLSEKVRIRSTPALDGLKGFDPQEAYPKYEGMKVITNAVKQNEMGRVSNLITDMTLKGAAPEEIARAVRHSMVVIDAEKHELDWKRSESENRINDLKKLYQDNGDGKAGASTIISRASSEMRVEARKDWYPTSKSIGENGEKIYTPTGETYLTGNLKGVKVKDGGKVYINEDKKTGKWFIVDKDPDTGKNVRRYVTEDDFKAGSIKENKRLQESTKMAEATDAYTLTSGGSKEHPGYRMEGIYAKFANEMKDLANQARLEYTKTPNQKRDPEAAAQYKEEVDSLKQKVALAKMSAPLERQAQLMANRVIAEKKASNPGMSKEELQKKKGQAIQGARTKLNSTKKKIEISDKEWKAIQAGAVSHTLLGDILNNADLDVLRQKATPRQTKTITPSMEALARSMEASGYTTAQIADRLGISSSSVYRIVKS